MQEANSVLKINWACAVTINPFVGFGKCIWSRITDQYIWKKLLTYPYFSFESVHGEAMLKMGWMVKKYNFSFLTGSLGRIYALSIEVLPWLK